MLQFLSSSLTTLGTPAPVPSVPCAGLSTPLPVEVSETGSVDVVVGQQPSGLCSSGCLGLGLGDGDYSAPAAQDASDDSLPGVNRTDNAHLLPTNELSVLVPPRIKGFERTPSSISGVASSTENGSATFITTLSHSTAENSLAVAREPVASRSAVASILQREYGEGSQAAATTHPLVGAATQSRPPQRPFTVGAVSGADKAPTGDQPSGAHLRQRVPPARPYVSSSSVKAEVEAEMLAGMTYERIVGLEYLGPVRDCAGSAPSDAPSSGSIFANAGASRYPCALLVASCNGKDTSLECVLCDFDSAASAERVSAGVRRADTSRIPAVPMDSGCCVGERLPLLLVEGCVDVVQASMSAMGLHGERLVSFCERVKTTPLASAEFLQRGQSFRDIRRRVRRQQGREQRMRIKRLAQEREEALYREQLRQHYRAGGTDCGLSVELPAAVPLRDGTRATSKLQWAPSTAASSVNAQDGFSSPLFLHFLWIHVVGTTQFYDCTVLERTVIPMATATAIIYGAALRDADATGLGILASTDGPKPFERRGVDYAVEWVAGDEGEDPTGAVESAERVVAGVDQSFPSLPEGRPGAEAATVPLVVPHSRLSSSSTSDTPRCGPGTPVSEVMGSSLLAGPRGSAAMRSSLSQFLQVPAAHQRSNSNSSNSASIVGSSHGTHPRASASLPATDEGSARPPPAPTSAKRTRQQMVSLPSNVFCQTGYFIRSPAPLAQARVGSGATANQLYHTNRDTHFYWIRACDHTRQGLQIREVVVTLTKPPGNFLAATLRAAFVGSAAQTDAPAEASMTWPKRQPLAQDPAGSKHAPNDSSRASLSSSPYGAGASSAHVISTEVRSQPDWALVQNPLWHSWDPFTQRVAFLADVQSHYKFRLIKIAGNPEKRHCEFERNIQKRTTVSAPSTASPTMPQSACGGGMAYAEVSRASSITESSAKGSPGAADVYTTTRFGSRMPSLSFAPSPADTVMAAAVPTTVTASTTTTTTAASASISGAAANHGASERVPPTASGAFPVCGPPIPEPWATGSSSANADIHVVLLPTRYECGTEDLAMCRQFLPPTASLPSLPEAATDADAPAPSGPPGDLAKLQHLEPKRILLSTTVHREDFAGGVPAAANLALRGATTSPAAAAATPASVFCSPMSHSIDGHVVELHMTQSGDDDTRGTPAVAAAFSTAATSLQHEPSDESQLFPSPRLVSDNGGDGGALEATRRHCDPSPQRQSSCGHPVSFSASPELRHPTEITGADGMVDQAAVPLHDNPRNLPPRGVAHEEMHLEPLQRVRRVETVRKHQQTTLSVSSTIQCSITMLRNHLDSVDFTFPISRDITVTIEEEEVTATVFQAMSATVSETGTAGDDAVRLVPVSRHTRITSYLLLPPSLSLAPPPPPRAVFLYVSGLIAVYVPQCGVHFIDVGHKERPPQYLFGQQLRGRRAGGQPLSKIPLGSAGNSSAGQEGVTLPERTGCSIAGASPVPKAPADEQQVPPDFERLVQIVLDALNQREAETYSSAERHPAEAACCSSWSYGADSRCVFDDGDVDEDQITALMEAVSGSGPHPPLWAVEEGQRVRENGLVCPPMVAALPIPFGTWIWLPGTTQLAEAALDGAAAWRWVGRHIVRYRTLLESTLLTPANWLMTDYRAASVPNANGEGAKWQRYHRRSCVANRQLAVGSSATDSDDDDGGGLRSQGTADHTETATGERRRQVSMLSQLLLPVVQAFQLHVASACEGVGTASVDSSRDDEGSAKAVHRRLVGMTCAALRVGQMEERLSTPRESADADLLDVRNLYAAVHALTSHFPRLAGEPGEVSDAVKVASDGLSSLQGWRSPKMLAICSLESLTRHRLLALFEQDSRLLSSEFLVQWIVGDSYRRTRQLSQSYFGLNTLYQCLPLIDERGIALELRDAIEMRALYGLGGLLWRPAAAEETTGHGPRRATTRSLVEASQGTTETSPLASPMHFQCPRSTCANAADGMAWLSDWTFPLSGSPLNGSLDSKARAIATAVHLSRASSFCTPLFLPARTEAVGPSLRDSDTSYAVGGRHNPSLPEREHDDESVQPPCSTHVPPSPVPSAAASLCVETTRGALAQKGPDDVIQSKESALACPDAAPKRPAPDRQGNEPGVQGACTPLLARKSLEGLQFLAAAVAVEVVERLRRGRRAQARNHPRSVGHPLQLVVGRDGRVSVARGHRSNTVEGCHSGPRTTATSARNPALLKLECHNTSKDWWIGVGLRLPSLAPPVPAVASAAGVAGISVAVAASGAHGGGFGGGSSAGGASGTIGSVNPASGSSGGFFSFLKGFGKQETIPIRRCAMTYPDFGYAGAGRDPGNPFSALPAPAPGVSTAADAQVLSAASAAASAVLAHHSSHTGMGSACEDGHPLDPARATSHALPAPRALMNEAHEGGFRGAPGAKKEIGNFFTRLFQSAPATRPSKGLQQRVTTTRPTPALQGGAAAPLGVPMHAPQGEPQLGLSLAQQLPHWWSAPTAEVAGTPLHLLPQTSVMAALTGALESEADLLNTPLPAFSPISCGISLFASIASQLRHATRLPACSALTQTTALYDACLAQVVTELVSAILSSPGALQPRRTRLDRFLLLQKLSESLHILGIPQPVPLSVNLAAYISHPYQQWHGRDELRRATVVRGPVLLPSSDLHFPELSRVNAFLGTAVSDRDARDDTTPTAANGGEALANAKPSLNGSSALEWYVYFSSLREAQSSSGRCEDAPYVSSRWLLLAGMRSGAYAAMTVPMLLSRSPDLALLLTQQVEVYGKQRTDSVAERLWPVFDSAGSSARGDSVSPMVQPLCIPSRLLLSHAPVSLLALDPRSLFHGSLATIVSSAGARSSARPVAEVDRSLVGSSELPPASELHRGDTHSPPGNARTPSSPPRLVRGACRLRVRQGSDGAAASLASVSLPPTTTGEYPILCADVLHAMLLSNLISSCSSEFYAEEPVEDYRAMQLSQRQHRAQFGGLGNAAPDADQAAKTTLLSDGGRLFVVPPNDLSPLPTTFSPVALRSCGGAEGGAHGAGAAPGGLSSDTSAPTPSRASALPAAEGGAAQGVPAGSQSLSVTLRRKRQQELFLQKRFLLMMLETGPALQGGDDLVSWPWEAEFAVAYPPFQRWWRQKKESLRARSTVEGGRAYGQYFKSAVRPERSTKTRNSPQALAAGHLFSYFPTPLTTAAAALVGCAAGDPRLRSAYSDLAVASEAGAAGGSTCGPDALREAAATKGTDRVQHDAPVRCASASEATGREVLQAFEMGLALSLLPEVQLCIAKEKAKESAAIALDPLIKYD